MYLGVFKYFILSIYPTLNGINVITKNPKKTKNSLKKYYIKMI